MTANNDIGRDRLGPAGDEFYSALMAVHEDLSLEESTHLNARLVLILANLVGDLETLKLAVQVAAQDVRRGRA